MGERHEQQSYRGRHRHGQHAHEKMLRITGHQGNTNQKHHEIPSHTSENWHEWKMIPSLGHNFQSLSWED